MTEPQQRDPIWPYLLVGICLGVIFTKSEVISWFRIQEMFRLQSFHMFGVIGSAVVVGAVSLFFIQKLGLRTRQGADIRPERLRWAWPGSRYWLGGFVFGLGWALSGACPGPIFTLLGNGLSAYLITLVAALVGTWTYGALRDRLPH